MKSPDLLDAIKPFINTLNSLNIPHYISGSIASSLYGIARATMDIDLVADIKQNQVPKLVSLLSDLYYVDEDTVNDAISQKSSFNLIHLSTMIKIDVFIHKSDPYNSSALDRKLVDRLIEEDENSDYYFASPEDIILNKLRWYDMGERVSERQWSDILGVIKVQAESLDIEYLEKWANYLGLSSLLKGAINEAEIK
jgi:hypothetical protein